MRALKVANIVLSAVLLIAAFILVIKGIVNAGSLVALAFPIFTFIITFTILQNPSLRLATNGLWLNGMLLFIFLLIDLSVLIIDRTIIENAPVVIIFQTLFIVFPAAANIKALRRMRTSLR